MVRRTEYDAVVVGSGPNGLAAAISIAREGHSVLVIEARDKIGGGCRTEEVTLPGFHHDICSAIHPMGAGSPFFRELPLERYGLRWIYPHAEVANPLDDGSAVVLHRSVGETAEGLGVDGGAYRRMMQPFVDSWDALAEQLLGPPKVPAHPLLVARFGIRGLRSAWSVAHKFFEGERARALFGGLAGHSILSFRKPYTAAFGMILGLAGHAIGWPLPAGGSQSIADALGAHLRSLGGEILTGRMIERFEELPRARAYLFDVSPRVLLGIAGDKLPSGYVRRLMRFRHGPGVFKVDYALQGPVPWKAAECSETATLHLGGTFNEIAASEEEVALGRHPERPFVITAQTSIFDPERAPAGKHTLWAYCHVPNSSTVDMTERVDSQIERFAPGFRDLVIGRNVMTCSDFERYNANYVGGDISGGSHDGLQLFFRPVIRRNPYTTPADDIFLCSASTPPGGGVHGMCGYHAARPALRKIRKS